MSDEREVVRAGYDAIAERYRAWSSVGWPTTEWVRKLLDLLTEPSVVLEVGCGNGIPAGRLIAERHDYTGVDISSAQLDFRVAKILKFGRTRTNIGFDIYNLMNSNPILTYNTAYNPTGNWLVPTSVLQSRFLKLSASIDF